MTGLMKTLALANCLTLLLVAGERAAAAGAKRGGVTAGGEAGQRRRAPRRAKRRMAERAEEGRVPQGVWGGDHVRMSVGADGARLEFDCARGQIVAPFRTDAAGRFDLPGTYTRQGPGPIRIGREPSARPARYAGHVEGTKMTLSVTLADGGRSLGDYTLTRGDEGHVVKCR